MPSTNPRNSIEGSTPSFVAEREQLGESLAGPDQVDDFLRRAGDDIGAAQLDGLLHPAAAVVEHPLVLEPLRRDPAMQGDHADDFEPGSGQGALQLGKTAALLEIGRDLVVPGLDRLVAGLARDLDLGPGAASAGSCWC